jgi:hypothetical protein
VWNKSEITTNINSKRDHNEKNIYLILVCILSFVSCCKTNEPVTTVKNEIKVKVYSTATWNSTTNKMDTDVGATVNLISNSDTITAVTNNNGFVTFSGLKEKVYYLVASKGDLSNLINKTTLNNKTNGYLIIGVYKSQEDIANSAFFSNAVVGGVKLGDMNGDFRINDDDKVEGNYLKFEYKYKDLNADGLIDVKDLLNGSLVQIDNQVGKTVFVGK